MSRSRRLLAALTLVCATSAWARPTSPASDVPQARPEHVVGAPRGARLSGAALDARTEEVAGLLRCPVCQGLSVADSRAGTAVAMKAQVRELLAAGYDEEQVLAYFERSYGGFVRLEPPLRGINWLVWLAPLGGLLLGGFVVLRALRASPAPAPLEPAAAQGIDDTALPERDTLPDDHELRAYLLRVRELAYGWPGGEPPEAR